MKILLAGDFQLRYKRPRRRLDESYFDTQQGKVRQLYDIAVREGCRYLVQPGDFFDGVDVPWFVVQHYVGLIRGYRPGVETLVVRGQHDLRYHSKNIKNTPLAVLERAGVVRVLTSQPLIVYEGKLPISFFGWSWNELELPDPKVGGGCKILVLHKMVSPEEMWVGQEGYLLSGLMFRKYPDYDLFVCGDNHQCFTEGSGSKHLVNCGSLMRANADQGTHRPCCYIYDTLTKQLGVQFLEVEPAAKVLDFAMAKKERERDKKLEVFVEELGSQEDLELNYLDNIMKALPRVGSGVREIVEEVLEDERVDT